MGAELSGRFYNVALAAVAVGYVLLLVVLLRADPGSDETVPAGAFSQPVTAGESNPAQLALGLARASATSKGLRELRGTIHSTCNASGGGELCQVSGFTRTTGVGACTISVFVPGSGGDAYVRASECR